MANILITEFMDEAQVELLSVNHNVTYDPELYKNSKTLLKEASNTHALIVRNKTNVDKKLLVKICYGWSAKCSLISRTGSNFLGIGS